MAHGTRLYSGAVAFVNEANNCRDNAFLRQPGSGRLGLLKAGQVVEVLDGPYNHTNGIVYWRVFSPSLQKIGYTAEGQPAVGNYWLNLAPIHQTSGINHRLLPGTEAFVETKSGQPNILRSDPAKTSRELAKVREGTIVTVLQGSAHQNTKDGWLWWPVEVNGLQGWMAEIDLKGETNLLPVTVPVPCM